MKRVISSLLIILHLATFGPIKEALAFSASSASFKLNSGTVNSGGKGRAASTSKLWQDAIGESFAGKLTSSSYILSSGFIPTIESNPPFQTQIIPNQNWKENETKPDAFDLDDYFSSDAGALIYTVSGNTHIQVNIDPATHKVSFSQAQAYSGTEKIKFTATDLEHSAITSNEITLQVEGIDNPPVLDFIPDITVNENDLVTITPHATDLDNDPITYTFTAPLDSTGKWQTDYNSANPYKVTVTATDATNLKDSQEVNITVLNVNRPPIIQPIPEITVNEGDLVTVTPIVSDPDNDAISLYYSSPLDSTGKWLTTFADAGAHKVVVTASDRIDTVDWTVNIIVNNVNRSPSPPILTLTKSTVLKNEVLGITLKASDPDNEAMSFSLLKDDAVITSGNINNNSTYTTSLSFSEEGTHIIKATLTDPGGLVSIAMVKVDVTRIDSSINPIMGDFNGDSLTDLGMQSYKNGTWEVSLSEKGEFPAATVWLRDFGTSIDWWPIGGDFNADGKSDIGIYNNTTGELKTAISTSSSFTIQGTALTASFASYSWQPFTGNFNADKYTDFALYNKDTGEVRIALGKVSGFNEFAPWLASSSSNTEYIAMGGDFNGDSLTDLCLFKKSTGEFKVIFSNSKVFVDSSIWKTGYAINQDATLSDFNNDGLTDIGYWDKATYKWYYAASTGASFTDKGIWLNSFGATGDDSASTADFNGDGITDPATFDKENIGINRWRTQLSTNKPADLLNQIDNGIGGKTQITYTYAASSDNPGLPFPVYVASSISLNNTLPAERVATYTQNFSFSGGYYDAEEREFRGFAKVKVSDPITNNYTETYFFQGKPGQDGALKGQTEKVLAYDGNNRKISESFNTYEVRKAGPSENILGAAFLTEQATTVYEENNSSLSTKTIYTYDNIGNPLTELSQGDTSITGDEKSSSTTYAKAYVYDPSTSSGFNRPLESTLKDKDSAVISKKTFEYDSRGNLAKDTIWIFNPLTSTENRTPTTYSYDSFGNLTSSTNAKGATVTTDYETTYYTYPTKVTNALGHTIQYIYDPKFGAVTQVTDPNGKISTTTYDSLGRVIRGARDDGGGAQVTVATYTYLDFNTKITTNAIGLSATEYIDGLGRKYKTTSQGEDGTSARQISSQTYFNNRGLTEKEELPHYINEDSSQISYARYEYDLRGRIKKTISDFPGTSKDAESSINYISPLYTESTDPQGHKKGTRKDVYGNIIEVIEFVNNNPEAKADGGYHTYYEYDIQGNLTKTIDNKNNTTQIFYDSIGKKLKMIDPDMGTWTYEYDILGNLTKQTDAKNQVLTFEYDQLNRLTKKSTVNGPQSIDLVTYVYDDQTKANCIGRLSKVNDLSGSTEFFYDTLGRETKSTKTIDATAYTVERTYDILDRLTTLKYPDGEAVNYAYDINSGLLEKVSNATNTINYASSINYNAKGQIKTINYGNNTTTTYTYGQDLRLSRILTTNNQQLTTLQDLNYIFDHNGNLNTLTDNLRSTIRTYDYDDLDRLEEVRKNSTIEFTYQYNSIGNMTYKSDTGVMTYGLNAGPHALTSAGGYTYTYDANGNMIQGKNKTLTYDTENRLTEVNELGKITSFVYDGDGGRVKKSTVNGPQSTETTYIGSLFEIESTVNSPQTTVKHIFAGSNRICSIKSVDHGLSTIDYYHSDHLGSSSIITDSTGSQVQHLEYTPYGTIAQNEGADVVKHKFTGKELDNTGLYFYSARYYDPEIGRFITADTIVQAPYDPQSLNRYSYCRNNPINYIDPSGHFFWFIAAIVIGAAMSAATAAIMGGDIGKAALMGALTGALFAGFSAFAQAAMKFALAGTTQVSLIGGARVATNIVSGVVGGAAAGAGGAAFAGADPGKGAGIGALSGGVFTGIGSIGGTGLGWDVARMGLYTAAGGGISELSGGSFGTGAAFTGTFAGADVLYRAMIRTQGYEQRASIETATKDGQAKKDAAGRSLSVKFIHDPQSRVNQVGFASKAGDSGFWTETGKSMSWVGKNIPLVQGTSFFHDIITGGFTKIFGPTANGFFNVPSMVPSFAITMLGSALYDFPATVGQVISDNRD